VADGTTLALGSQPQACRIVAHGRRAGRGERAALPGKSPRSSGDL